MNKHVDHHTSISILEISSREEYEGVFPILKELKSTPPIEEVVRLCHEATKRDQFQLVAAYLDKKCIGVMGYRILFDLTHGKHLYVDDLVITEAMRSKRIGEIMVSYAEKKAKEHDCVALRLCTGLENHGSQKFYSRLGWMKRSYAFKKYLKPWTTSPSA